MGREVKHRNCKGEACDGKGPRRSETAHGHLGKHTSARANGAIWEADDGKGNGEGKAVDEEALVAVEKAGLQGASAKQRKALRSAWRMARPTGERKGIIGLAASAPPPPFCNRVANCGWSTGGSGEEGGGRQREEGAGRGR